MKNPYGNDSFSDILFVAVKLQLTLREAEALIQKKQIISLMKEEIGRGNVEHTYVGSFYTNPQHNTSNQTKNKEWKFGNINPDFELHTKDMPA
jgi:hypothetical protein